jgi:hypothetical protein
MSRIEPLILIISTTRLSIAGYLPNEPAARVRSHHYGRSVHEMQILAEGYKQAYFSRSPPTR